MSDDSDPRRDALTDFLQDQGPPDFDRPAVLTGWVIVADWMDDEGERWLTRGYSSSLAKWHAFGLLHEALFGNWAEDDDD